MCSLEDDNAFMNDYGFMNNSRGSHLLFKMINIEDTRETLIGSSIIHHSKSLGSLNEGPSHPSKASPLMGKRVCLPLSTAPFFKPQDHLVSLGSSIHQAEDWSRLPLAHFGAAIIGVATAQHVCESVSNINAGVLNNICFPDHAKSFLRFCSSRGVLVQSKMSCIGKNCLHGRWGLRISKEIRNSLEM